MRKKFEKNKDPFEGVNGILTYEQVYKNADLKNQRKMDFLKFNGHFSDSEIVDLVLGREKMEDMLLDELWHNPDVILPQKDALIYLIKIVLHKPCDGSEKIKLSAKSKEYLRIRDAFARGLKSGNINGGQRANWKSYIEYANRQINGLLKKAPELNGNEKYSPENPAITLYKRDPLDPQMSALYMLYKDGDLLSKDQKELIYKAMVRRDLELTAEAMKPVTDFSAIPKEIRDELGIEINSDGSIKKAG